MYFVSLDTNTFPTRLLTYLIKRLRCRIPAGNFGISVMTRLCRRAWDHSMAAEQQRREEEDALKKANEGIEKNDTRFKIKAVNVSFLL